MVFKQDNRWSREDGHRYRQPYTLTHIVTEYLLYSDTSDLYRLLVQGQALEGGCLRAVLMGLSESSG